MPAQGPRAKGVGWPPSIGAIPVALYYHVRDKDEMLLLVLETRAQRIPRPGFPDAP